MLTSQSTESRAFGTSGISAAVQPRMPETSGDRSLGTKKSMRCIISAVVMFVSVGFAHALTEQQDIGFPSLDIR
jgi:hypothetical protein